VPLSSKRIVWFLAPVCAILLRAPWDLRSQTQSPESLFQQAVTAQERGDDAAAVNYYQQLLHLRPDAIAVRVNLGVALAHEKRFDEAIEQYRLVLAHDPANRFARMNMVVAYREAGNAIQATVELEKMHQANASDDEVSMMLADTYSQSGRYADAIPVLLNLEAGHPDDPDLQEALGNALVHQGRLEEGAVRLERSAEKNASAGDYVLAGQARFALGQYDIARRDADASQRLNNNQPGVATLIGMILQATSDYEGAESSLLKAVAQDRVDFNANLYLGGVFYFKRDLIKAKQYLSQALALQPGSPQARYELALVERAEGDLNGAVKDLMLVVQAAPEWLQPHVELAALYYRLHDADDGAKERALVDRMIADQQRNAKAPLN
jgi:tetratricopeptide (TPR) repeat protein